MENGNSLAHERIVKRDVPHNRRSNEPRGDVHLPTDDDLALRLVDEALDPLSVSLSDDVRDGVGLLGAVGVE